MGGWGSLFALSPAKSDFSGERHVHFLRKRSEDYDCISKPALIFELVQYYCNMEERHKYLKSVAIPKYS